MYAPLKADIPYFHVNTPNIQCALMSFMGVALSAHQETFIYWGGTEAQAYINRHVMPTELLNDFYGLAIVYREASAFPEVFYQANYIADHIRLVADVPVGNIVFCLPITQADTGWRPVIVEARTSEGIRARFTWMHPHCVTFLPGSWSRFLATVHHTKKRGRKRPTINIGPDEPGVRVFQDRLILDARWHSGSFRGLECTGYCLGVCLGILDDEHFAQIIHFARMLTRHKTGEICCLRGKHRSVAVANILFHMFRISVDRTNGATERCHQCCNTKMQEHIPVLLNRLRAFPRFALVGQMLLANALCL